MQSHNLRLTNSINMQPEQSSRQQMNDTFSKEAWNKITQRSKQSIIASETTVNPLDDEICFSNLTRQQIQQQKKDHNDYMAVALDSLPQLSTSNSRKVN